MKKAGNLHLPSPDHGSRHISLQQFDVYSIHDWGQMVPTGDTWTMKLSIFIRAFFSGVVAFTLLFLAFKILGSSGGQLGKFTRPVYFSSILRHTPSGLADIGFISTRQEDIVLTPCDSLVYCQGDMLRSIQLARPFADSKTFVDMPTIRPVEKVLADFATLSQPLQNDSLLHQFLDRNFGPAGTEIAPRLLDLHNGTWTAGSTRFSNIKIAEIRNFVDKVIGIWPSLIREYVGKPTCYQSTTGTYESTPLTECANSFIPLKHPFVVPGGRFREPYYWDSFWVIEGLLRSGGSYVPLARSMIENFLDLVEQFGFVPNGARVYYLNRSQPPILSQMVEAYVNHIESASYPAADDNERERLVQTILVRAVPLLEKEYGFWMTNRTVEVRPKKEPYLLNIYSVKNNQPRPESYWEDWDTAGGQDQVSYSDDLYAQLASGAESGWDFSSRWMRQLISKADLANSNQSVNPLQTLAVTSTVPVDLNSILYMTEITMSRLHMRMIGNPSAAYDIGTWTSRADDRAEAMVAVFWNDLYASFFDYNLTSRSHNLFVPRINGSIFASTAYAEYRATSDFYIHDTMNSDVEQPTKGVIIPDDHLKPDQTLALYGSSLFPFWAGAASKITTNPALSRQALARLDFLSRNTYGLAASNFPSGQQWDEPNVWAPLVHVAMAGSLRLAKDIGTTTAEEFVPDPLLTQLSLRLAQQFFDSTYCTWMATGGNSSETGYQGVMFEKYSSESKSEAGGGGEYEVVPGFGWSNGVLIWIADVFGPDLVLPDCSAKIN